MPALHCLTDYDVKILLAFHEALKGDKKFSGFLFTTGFPELTALAAAINSDTEALDWLLANYPEFGVLSNAIDNEEHAIAWLEKYNCDFLSKFAAACRKEDEAIKWFADNNLKVFILIIRTIHDTLLFQSWDSSDIHRRRR
ncbi:MAG: hypothetical protein LBV46_00920 [Bacteroidales bacterium]|jgi:hypothetical protein|nr:hypothetical protein [Bacteroidales bacterium]